MLPHPTHQQPLGTLSSDARSRSTTFLDDLNRLVDWERFRPRLTRLYPSKTGRPAHDPVKMLKLLFVERLYNLSDEEVVRALEDRRSFERFVAIDRIDSSSLTYYRQRLVGAGLALDGLIEEINQQIAGHGYAIQAGSIVDASLIPSRHRPGARYEKGFHAGEVIDPDATRTVRERNGTTTSYSGMKLHLKCSTDGMIQTVRVTPNTVHDTTLLPELIGAGPPCAMLYADRGYDSEANRAVLFRKGIRDGIMRRMPRTKAHKRREITARNRRLARPRSRVEGIFGVLKRTTTARLRYRGAATNTVQATLDSMIYNLKRFIRWKLGRSPALYLA